LLQAGVFTAALAITLAVPAAPGQQQRPTSGFVAEMTGGLRYIADNRTVATLLLLATVPVVNGLPYQQLLALFVRDVYGGGPETLGLLFSANGVGAIVGTLALARFGGRGSGEGAAFGPLIAATAAFGLGLMLFALSPTLWLGLLAMAGVGVAFACYSALNNAALLQATEDRYRGRVQATYSLVHGLIPLGALPAGLLADRWGGPATVLLSGALVVVLSLAVGWGMRGRTRSGAPPVADAPIG
jgi:ENTS family enterobactin (siderophore) exporter